MNLAVLKRSRRKPMPGDVFVMSPPVDGYLYGRVIANDVLEHRIGILIYVYRDLHPVLDCVPILSKDELLLVPTITNKLPWSRGYFQHIENIPLKPEDTFDVHCFKDVNGQLVNEYREPISTDQPPIGPQALDSFRTIDDEVSRALGIDLAPD